MHFFVRALARKTEAQSICYKIICAQGIFTHLPATFTGSRIRHTCNFPEKQGSVGKKSCLPLKNVKPAEKIIASYKNI
jgi:hypothetical protein